jgi:hypothetical protein
LISTIIIIIITIQSNVVDPIINHSQPEMGSEICQLSSTGGMALGLAHYTRMFFTTTAGQLL